VISDGGDLEPATRAYLDAVERARGTVSDDYLVRDKVSGLIAVANAVEPYCGACARMIDRERAALGS
jgi:hypothetical protein